jgi:uncharacterized protein (TIGR04255 family)
MAERQQYPKPPLIEAVLELRFEQNMSERELTRLKDRLQRAFPAADELRNFQAKLEDQGAVQMTGLAGYKLTAKNGTDVVMLQPNALVTSRLAPYEGWERLVEHAKENYEAFEKIAGYKRVVRVGARFVNRIDVPNRLLANRHVGDLLNIKIALPADTASSLGEFSLAQNFVHKESGLKVLAQVAVGEPALIDHTSVFVDLDCAIDEQIPAKIDQVWELVGTMRDPKDNVFESFLTPEVRELFN